MTYNRLNDEEKRDLVQMSLDGKTNREIAEWLGCSNVAVAFWRKKLSLPKCNTGQPVIWTREKAESLIIDCKILKNSHLIAEKYKIKPYYVRQALDYVCRKFNIDKPKLRIKQKV